MAAMDVKNDQKIERKGLKIDHEFRVPTKQIKKVEDIKKWENSEGYQVCILLR